MQLSYWISFVLVFAAVFALGAGLVAVIAGGGGRRLRARLALVRDQTEAGAMPASLIREKYLRRLSPLERLLEELPGMQKLARMVEQAGHDTPAYRVVVAAALGAVAAFALVLMFTKAPGMALLAAAAVLPLPLLRMNLQRSARLARFEEQLPDALEMMSRAMRAGMPLTECFKFVAEEMPEPISLEFRTTWSHINYGIEVKASFADLVERIPSTSLRAMTTAVMVQRETGGNLAEILEKIAAVLRGRFRFQRRLRTLTAEGRMSAWILILMPFVLSAVLAITSPAYLPMLTREPLGQKLIVGALVLICLGVVWIRQVIKVRV